MSTATLNSEKKKALIPQLRFQEFDGEWKLKNLEEISSWASGGTPPKDNPLFWDGDIPWISASSMRGIVYSDSELKITDAGLKKGSKLARKGSLLILVRGSMLFNKIPIGIVSKDVSFNQDVKSIVVDGKYSTSEFILNWFTAFEPKILNMVTGTGIGAGKLDLPDLKALKIALPTLPEQQKIASFLCAVDEKTQQLSRKKELLSQYKKGVMQQLFSGKLRFAAENGNHYADWEKVKLYNLCEYKNGGSFENYVCDDGEYNLISLNSIDINGKIKNQHKKVSITDNSLKKGDLIMVLSDVAYGNFLGLTDIVPGDNFVLNQRMGALKPIKDFNSFYLKTFINFNQNYFKLKGQGSSQQNLSKGDIINFIVNLPCLEEQQKIANFLSNIDTKIEATNQQINQTQSFKKGLLQQLFV